MMRQGYVSCRIVMKTTRLHCRSDDASDDSADYRRAERAPILGVESVVVVVASGGFMVTRRLVAHCGTAVTRFRVAVAHDVVTMCGLRLWRTARFVTRLGVACGCLSHLTRRLGSLYGWRLASLRLASARCGIGGAGERDSSDGCDCESFDDLVHCFVPLFCSRTIALTLG